MPTLLLHSPADVVSRVLIALGLGSDPANNEAWPVFVSAEPGDPDNCLTLFDTPWRGDGRSMIDGEAWHHHGFQVRVRSATHKEGFARASAIHEGLDQDVHDDIVTLDGTRYLVHAVSGTNILCLGKNVPHTKRSLFTINGLTTIRVLP